MYLRWICFRRLFLVSFPLGRTLHVALVYALLYHTPQTHVVFCCSRCYGISRVPPMPYPLSLPPRATTAPVYLPPPVVHVETHNRRLRPSRPPPRGAPREPRLLLRRAPPPPPPRLPPSGGGASKAPISARADVESIAARVVCGCIFSSVLSGSLSCPAML